jgi:hypothetical protein
MPEKNFGSLINRIATKSLANRFTTKSKEKDNTSNVIKNKNEKKNNTINTSDLKKIGNNNIVKYKIDKALLLKSNKNVGINPKINVFPYPKYLSHY